MKFLEHLQNASSAEKTRYALVGAAGVTFVITAIWTTTLPARFSKIGEATDTITNNTAAAGSSISDIIQKAQDNLSDTGDPTQNTDSNNNTQDSTQTDSALDELTGPHDVTSTSSTTPTTLERNATIDAAQAPASIQTNTAQAPIAVTPPEKKVTEPSVPQVILIGTTTSQNTQ